MTIRTYTVYEQKPGKLLAVADVRASSAAEALTWFVDEFGARFGGVVVMPQLTSANVALEQG